MKDDTELNKLCASLKYFGERILKTQRLPKPCNIVEIKEWTYDTKFNVLQVSLQSNM